MTAMVMVVAIFAQTQLVPRFGPRPLVARGDGAGDGRDAAADAVATNSSYAADVLPTLLLMGIGLGLIFAPAMSTAT